MASVVALAQRRRNIGKRERVIEVKFIERVIPAAAARHR
jgi:hypothetical protein